MLYVLIMWISIYMSSSLLQAGWCHLWVIRSPVWIQEQGSDVFLITWSQHLCSNRVPSLDNLLVTLQVTKTGVEAWEWGYLVSPLLVMCLSEVSKWLLPSWQFSDGNFEIGKPCRHFDRMLQSLLGLNASGPLPWWKLKHSFEMSTRFSDLRVSIRELSFPSLRTVWSYYHLASFLTAVCFWHCLLYYSTHWDTSKYYAIYY